jgi:hypothetical protein
MTVLRPRSPERGRQQHARLLPVAPHGAIGDAERSGDLGIAQAAEVAHLDQSAEALVERADFLERLMDAQDLVLGRSIACAQVVVERHVHGVLAAPLRGLGTRDVHDDRPHGRRGVRQEMRAVAGVHALRIAQLQVALVDQRRGAQVGIGESAPQPQVRNAAQLGVEQLEEAVQRCPVAGAGALDQLRDVAHG